MKIFAFAIITLLFSFEAFAYENNEISINKESQQLIIASDMNRNLQNAQHVYWNQSSVTSLEPENETSTESRDELFSGVLICALIILIYSLYWHKNKMLE